LIHKNATKIGTSNEYRNKQCPCCSENYPKRRLPLSTAINEFPFKDVGEALPLTFYYFKMLCTVYVNNLSILVFSCLAMFAFSGVFLYYQYGQGDYCLPIHQKTNKFCILYEDWWHLWGIPT
jgi:hypothetical protein